MENLKCSLLNAVNEKGRNDFVVDSEQSLMTNLRIWCASRAEDMCYFLPEEYIEELNDGGNLEGRNILAYFYIHEERYPLDTRTALVDQITAEAHPLVIGIECEGYIQKTDYSAQTKEELMIVRDEVVEERSIPEEDVLEEEAIIEEEEDFEDGKKKKGFGRILRRLILLAVLVGIGYFGVTNYPYLLLRFHTIKGNYPAAVESYNHYIAGNAEREASANPVVEKCIQDIQEDYVKEAISPEETIAVLDTFSAVQNEALQQSVVAVKDFVDQNENVKALYAVGLEQFEAKQYLEAMAAYSKIPAEHSLSEAAVKGYEDSRNILMDSLGTPSTLDEYQKCLDTLNGYLKVVQDEVFLSRQAEIQAAVSEMVEAQTKDEILASVDKALKENDYEAAFTALEAGLKQLPGDSDFTSRRSDCQEAYVAYIRDNVDKLVAEEDFDGALQVLSDATKIYNSEDFKSMIKTVTEQQDANVKTYTADRVKFLSCKGNMTAKDQKDSYQLKATESGVYTFTMLNTMNGFNVRLSVQNAANEYAINGDVLYSSGSYTSCRLEAGQTYTVTVEQRDNLGTYEFEIGQEKACVDISDYDVIEDSIEFGDQLLEYEFKPSISGRYHFGFTNMIKDFRMRIDIQDSLAYSVGSDDYLYNDDGVTADLEAGETYHIYLRQKEKQGDFTLTIGKQKASKVLTLNEVVEENIKFVDQCLIYTFKPAIDGDYGLQFHNMVNDYRVRVDVQDSLEYSVGSDDYVYNDEEVTFTAKANEEYVIYILQKEKFGPISITLKRS